MIYNANMVDDRTVYISGPIGNKGKCSDEEIKQNVLIAEEIYGALIEKGYAPYCPHLSYYPDKKWRDENIRELPHEVWLRMDFHWVRKCKYFFYMKPEEYGESSGALMEYNLALKEGKRIFYNLDEVPNKLEIPI